MKPISEDDLHAWADGRLPDDRRVAVEGWFAAHPEARARAEAWRAHNAALHRAFDARLDEPVPMRLMAAARAGRGLPLPRFALARVAAVFGWLALGAVAGFVARGPVAPGAAPPSEMPGLARQAALAHAVYAPEVRHPVEVGADQEAHLAAWLSKRLGADVKPPHLEAAGFGLVGGRLLPGEYGGRGGAVAQFMYQDGAGRRLTLYVRHKVGSEAETAFRHAQEDGIGVFYWIDGPFGYALSGTLPKAELLEVATVVYRQLAR